MLLVRIQTEDGLSGWGEAFAHAGVATKAMLDSMVVPLLLGEDAENISALMESVRRKIHLFGLSGPAIYAVSGSTSRCGICAGNAKASRFANCSAAAAGNWKSTRVSCAARPTMLSRRLARMRSRKATGP